MAEIIMTKMPSNGEVLIPEEIRKRFGWKSSLQFIVVAEKDVLILKAITPPSMEEFDELIAEARKQARQAGMKRSDITAAIAKVRGNQ